MKLNNLMDVDNPVKVPVANLKPHPSNPRKQNKQAMQLLEKSLEAFGTFRNLLVNDRMEVLGGNQLLSLLKKKKIKEVSVIKPVRELTEDEEKGIILFDNQNSFHKGSNQFDIELVFNDFDTVMEDFNILPEEFDFNMREEEEEKAKIDFTEDTREGKMHDESIYEVKNSVFFNAPDCKYGIPPLREDMLLDCNIDDICAKANQPTDPDKTYLVLYSQFAVNEKYKDAVIGFFLHDHVFESIYNNSMECLQRLSSAGIKGILTPNFSLWANEPIALQINSAYKTQWCGRFYQENGIKVMPTINWSDEDSYDFCFSGVPKYAKKVIVQCRNLSNELARKRFLKGIHEAHNRLEFEEVLIYGGNLQSSKEFLETNMSSSINWTPLREQNEIISEILKQRKKPKNNQD